jgi:ATP-dependent Zn protease
MVKKKNQAWRSWFMIAMIALAFFSMYRLNPNPAKVRELSQLEFYNAINAGKIVEPVVRLFDRDENETYLTGEAETDELDKEGSPVKERYRVQLVPGENETLMQDLLEQNIRVVVKEKRSAISPFVTQLLFFFGFLALFYWFFYRRMSGQSGVLVKRGSLPISINEPGVQ